MDSHGWDVRYSGDDLVWSATPNQFLVTETSHLEPGRALDLACGEGRNAIYLAERGWEATGVDFSEAGLAKAAKMAKARGVTATWIHADVLDWVPDSEYDLVAVFYLQLDAAGRARALATAAGAVAPEGTLLVVAHDADNLARGVGGPQDPSVLYRVAELEELAESAGLEIEKATQVTRQVDTDDGPREAIDTLLRAVRPH